MRTGGRGAVLLLVVGVVAVLSILALSMAGLAGTEELHGARVIRDAAFRRLVDSGDAVARGIIADAKAAPHEWWGGDWNREVRFALAPDEKARVRLYDESGKINISRSISFPAARDSLRRTLDKLFDYLERHEPESPHRWPEVRQKVASRLDLHAGARSPTPLVTLDGLREAGLDLSQVFAEDGLARYLTCVGDGRINLNTAPRAVLYTLDESLDDDAAERIARFRGEGDGEPGEYRPLASPDDLTRIEGLALRRGSLPESVQALLTRIRTSVTTTSTTFSARIEATAQGHARLAWTFYTVTRTSAHGTQVERMMLEELVP